MKRLKRVLSIILVVSIFASLFVLPVNAASSSKYYSDIPNGAAYIDATNYLYEHNIMQGTSSNNFSPNGTLTRGQVVTIMWRMLNKPSPEGSSKTFVDVPYYAYYADAIAWASSSNVSIASGIDSTHFNPNGAVTNQEFFTFLYRFARYCGYATSSESIYTYYFNKAPLTNRGTFSGWAKVGVGWAYSAGFYTSYTLSTMNATTYCKRKEAAQYIHQFYLKFQKKYALVVVNTNVEWPLTYLSTCKSKMRILFSSLGANRIVTCENIKRSVFSQKMTEAFGDAKKLDICYLYCASHGEKNGLRLFRSETNLTPSELGTQINNYNGTFVILISACHSGTFIDDGNMKLAGTELCEETNEFNPEEFVVELCGEDPSIIEGAKADDLRNASKMKVICSCEKDENSNDSVNQATFYWCKGLGYQYATNEKEQDRFLSYEPADIDENGYVSIEELYLYAGNEVLENYENQHMVRYPQHDSFPIDW